MKVAILHSRYRSGSTSGENRVIEDEMVLLRRAGHDVVSWTPTPDLAMKLPISVGIRTIWSKRGVTAVTRLADEFQPDVIHVHNMFPELSPTVLRAANRLGIPTVLTLHNYRLLCLPGILYREGEICELCVGKLPWSGVRFACYQDSHAASAALGSSISLHRGIRTFEGVQRFLAVSQFLADRYISSGLLATDRVIVKRNFAWPTALRSGPGSHFLFAGRLTEEKGILVLLEAWKRKQTPGPLVIAGDGPLRSVVDREAMGNVQVLGDVPPRQLAHLIRGARALVVPSTWYEGSPRTITEAYAAAVPVVASNIGALPEVVQDGESGVLAGPGDADELLRACWRLSADEDSVRMGREAAALWRSFYTPEIALGELENAYHAAGAARSRI
jgi:glycosyltransferase involved in cell wall biosynthesis